MTTIAIIPENPGSTSTTYLAIAGKVLSVGKTPGQALDAVTAQLSDGERGTLLVVQNLAPDALFSSEQQRKLRDLMVRWRMARDQKVEFPVEEQRELESLVKAELKAATVRAGALADGLAS
jgi:hypothetical protein